MPEIVAIIPARFGSTRFPGKAVAILNGKPIIQHVYERVRQAKSLSDVYVATDDERIFSTVTGFGGKAIMTSGEHKSGTDRIAEAVSVSGGDIIVNVQGDEPLIEPSVIDAVSAKITNDSEIVCSTACTPIKDETMYKNPNAVKVVMDSNGTALYFSRSPLPFYRDGGFGGAYLHIGIYCFRKDFLKVFTSLRQTPLEKAENLEQLRIIENGYKIGVVVTDYHSFGVDTPDDLEKVKKIIAGNSL